MRQVLGAGALGRPRGMGGRGRWEGGSGWGAHVNSWLIHVNVWRKPLQYCKVISLQLIKINEKKKERYIILQIKKKKEESACSSGDAGPIPGREDPLEEGVATTPVFLPGEPHGQRGLVGHSPWGHKESDTTSRLSNNKRPERFNPNCLSDKCFNTALLTRPIFL